MGRTGAAKPSYAEATTHLRDLDPVWERIVEAVGECRLLDRRRATNFEFLVRALVGQQISVAAAASIFERLCGLLGGAPSPEALLAVDEEALRGVGLSRPKASYLRDLAIAATAGDLDLEAVEGMSDVEMLAGLTAIRGIGVWTAEVFMALQLGRPDVLPAGDGGLQRAVQQAWNLPERPGEQAVRELAEPWRPWRSVATWYLWGSLQVELPA